MAGEPEEILFDHRGVDHQQELPIAGAVGDQVVDHAAAFVEHERVLAMAGSKAGDVVGEHPVEPGGGGLPADEELAHVGNVEDAGALAHGVVLVDDRGVLDRHVPAGEGDEARAELDMCGFQRAAVQVGRHAAQPATRLAGLSIRRASAERDCRSECHEKRHP